MAGFSGAPDEQLNPKKKIFETVSQEFTTSAERVAVYRGRAFMTSHGPCTVPSLVGAVIR